MVNNIVCSCQLESLFVDLIILFQSIYYGPITDMPNKSYINLNCPTYLFPGYGSSK